MDILEERLQTRLEKAQISVFDKDAVPVYKSIQDTLLPEEIFHQFHSLQYQSQKTHLEGIKYMLYQHQMISVYVYAVKVGSNEFTCILMADCALNALREISDYLILEDLIKIFHALQLPQSRQ